MEVRVQLDGKSKCCNQQEQSFASNRRVAIEVWPRDPIACVLASMDSRQPGVDE